MKKIFVSDITLRAAAEEKKALSFRERLSVAKAIDASGADAIEFPALSGNKEDAVIYRTIASSIKNSLVCIPVGDSDESISSAYECVKDAANSCLQVVLPVSTVQMEYMYHIKAPKMLERIANLCSKAKALCNNVEFVVRDASRAETEFVADCCKVAIENGATAITLCDDAGIYFPSEFANLVTEVASLGNAKIYIQPSDQLSLAAACAIEAIKSGADGIKTSACSKYLRADTFADIIRAKGTGYDITCNLDITAIHNILSGIIQDEPATSDASGNADVQSFCLDKNSTISDVITATSELGYELSEEDNGRIYEEFKRVVSKKSSISTKELEAIVANTAMQVPSTFHVVSYVVNSGNIITATANVTLEKNGERLSGVSTGDGPIDAAFHAIEQIIGHHYELDDFRIQAVTKGREAVGSSLIRLRNEGKLYSGNGLSTDIVGACIRAYINALNKIVYEGN